MNIENLTKDYIDSTGHIVHLLEDIDLNINEGEFTTILAPNGAGKSSLLNIIAGLETPSSGKIEDDSKKKIFIPTESSSFPWLNVKENILLNISDSNDTELQEIINLVGLEGYKDHYPNNKSLGFRFRISLARAIMNKADLIVIDEPFTKMRDEVRKGIYLLLRKIQNEKKISVVLGTSNISEAILLSDKIFLMDKDPGRIMDSFEIQFADPIRKNFSDSNDFTDYRERIKTYLTKVNPNKILNVSL
ncbi:MAG: ABC transporter ATP-binding protein [Melioribacteraceae bacterium]|nr:ABC transporter ATP-binding protein [Melioribacteraceae bacterium]